MGLNKHRDELCKILDDLITEIVKKDKVSMQELDALYKASAIVLDLETEKAMQGAEHEQGYSNHYPWFMNNNGKGNVYGHPYESAYDGAYDGAYRASMDSGYSMRRERDGRTGRYMNQEYGYSRDKNHMIEKLEHMLEEAGTEKERRALQQCLDKMEQI